MTEEDRIAKILTTLQKIEDSGQTVRAYYKKNDVPFSRAQYYTDRKTLQNYGEGGLRDKRKAGNYTKLTERLKDYIVSTVKENRGIPSSNYRIRF